MNILKAIIITEEVEKIQTKLKNNKRRKTFSEGLKICSDDSYL
jgi:hypothetical protein